MRRAVRVGLVVLGAAMAVYGAASLTGGWLGTPPWWTTEWRKYRPTEWRIFELMPPRRDGPDGAWEFILPREGREWISGGVVAAGLALVVVGAWPRRRAGAAL